MSRTGRHRSDPDETWGGAAEEPVALEDRDERRLVLFVLGHPEAERAGERAILFPEGAEDLVRLSRLEPDFEGDGPRPLGSGHLSRAPVLLEGESDGVRLRRAGSRSLLRVDEREIDDQIVLGFDALRRGVVIELSGVVALLLKSVVVYEAPASEPREIIGPSPQLAGLRRELQRVAPTDVAVLLSGETGTGKELVAQALHRLSRRAEGPFVAVNLAAIPPELVAAELFGNVKGAFTGATRSREGFFGRADGGTIFLDEIGDIGPAVQATLLRVLEAGEIHPVGSSETRIVDVRVIAASDFHLVQRVATGDFRAPLLHRLAGYEIEIAPLRQRREDVGPLFLHFLREAWAELEPPDRGSGEASVEGPWPVPSVLIAALTRFDWPGNVRQLRNVASQIALSSQGRTRLELPAPVLRLLRESSQDVETARRPSSYRDPSEIEEQELRETLRRHRYRLKPAARELGLSRTSLYGLIDRTPGIRRARDLGRAEIDAALEAHDSDLERAAEQLEVSPEALQQRLRELGAVGEAGDK